LQRGRKFGAFTKSQCDCIITLRKTYFCINGNTGALDLERNDITVGLVMILFYAQKLITTRFCTSRFYFTKRKDLDFYRQTIEFRGAETQILKMVVQ